MNFASVLCFSLAFHAHKNIGGDPIKILSILYYYKIPFIVDVVCSRHN